MYKGTRAALYILILALISTALAGCEGMSGVNSKSAVAETAPYPYDRLAPVAPPARKPETPPDIQNPRTELWKPGFWSYRDGNFDWTPGDVIARPSPTAVWVGAFWLQHDYGWAFVPGHWM